MSSITGDLDMAIKPPQQGCPGTGLGTAYIVRQPVALRLVVSPQTASLMKLEFRCSIFDAAISQTQT